MIGRLGGGLVGWGVENDGPAVGRGLVGVGAAIWGYNFGIDYFGLEARCLASNNLASPIA